MAHESQELVGNCVVAQIDRVPSCPIPHRYPGLTFLGLYAVQCICNAVAIEDISVAPTPGYRGQAIPYLGPIATYVHAPGRCMQMECNCYSQPKYSIGPVKRMHLDIRVLSNGLNNGTSRIRPKPPNHHNFRNTKDN